MHNDAYKTLYDQSPIGLWRTRISDGKFLHANPAAAKIFGCTLEDLETHLSTDFYDKSQRQELLADLRKNGVVRDFEVQLKRCDGAAIWASVCAVIHADQDYIEGSIQDITDKKFAEAEELQRHWNELEKITVLQQNIKKKIEETEQLSLYRVAKTA